MILMNHIITHGNIRKAVNLLSAVLWLHPLPAAPLSGLENITFTYDCQLLVREFKSLIQSTGCHHDFSGLKLPIQCFTVECRELIVIKLCRNPLCSGAGRTENDYPVFLLFPRLYILHQKLEMIVIGLYLL